MPPGSNARSLRSLALTLPLDIHPESTHLICTDLVRCSTQPSCCAQCRRDRSCEPQASRRHGHIPKGTDRVPAQHVRRQGIRYEYMCLNVYHQRLSVSQQKHWGWRPWLKFISHERSRYTPDQRVYVIQDNFSAHWTPEVGAWARENSVSLVPTATNASWMNPVEYNAGDI